MSATSAVPAHVAPISGDQPATGTAVAVVTHDPREDEAPLPDFTRAALDIAMDRVLANPAVDSASVTTTVAASPLGLGSDDGSVPDDGVTEKPAAEANAFSARAGGRPGGAGCAVRSRPVRQRRPVLPERQVAAQRHRMPPQWRMCQGGDSGVPIYTIRSDGGVAAKGVLSGGSSNTSGSCWDCFTDTSLAEKALAGVLRVQAPR